MCDRPRLYTDDEEQAVRNPYKAMREHYDGQEQIYCGSCGRNIMHTGWRHTSNFGFECEECYRTRRGDARPL